VRVAQECSVKRAIAAQPAFTVRTVRPASAVEAPTVHPPVIEAH